MFSEFHTPVRQILTGNLLLVFCLVFYFAWWLIAFHPTHAVKGFRSGWLLIPACVFGLLAIVRIASGCGSVSDQSALIPGRFLLIGGILCYFILLVVSTGLAKRPLTSELLLFVGLAVLLFWEVSMLYGQACFGKGCAYALFVGITAVAAVSFICYLLYYGLDVRKGYVDGMIPLLLGAAETLAVTACTLLRPLG